MELPQPKYEIGDCLARCSADGMGIGRVDIVAQIQILITISCKYASVWYRPKDETTFIHEDRYLYRMAKENQP